MGSSLIFGIFWILNFECNLVFFWPEKLWCRNKAHGSNSDSKFFNYSIRSCLIIFYNLLKISLIIDFFQFNLNFDANLIHFQIFLDFELLTKFIFFLARQIIV